MACADVCLRRGSGALMAEPVAGGAGLGLAGVGAAVERAGAETGIGEGFPELGEGGADGLGRARRVGAELAVDQAAFHPGPQPEASEVGGLALEREGVRRADERREGTGGVSPCRSLGSPSNYKNNDAIHLSTQGK